MSANDAGMLIWAVAIALASVIALFGGRRR